MSAWQFWTSRSFAKLAQDDKGIQKYERTPGCRAKEARSNCVDCQEKSGFQSSFFLSMALRMVKILCMQATKATFFSFPLSSKRS
jgi:hypothetical protein